MKESMSGAENNLKRLSLLSRFNVPNASKKPRNVSEYTIELDNPYKPFAPGDRLKGHLVLNVERPVRITHLTICLHGVVKVLKNGRIPGESTSRWRSYLATGQGKRGEAYFGNGLAALFKDEVILAGDGCLATSLYRFEFDLELPTHGLPSSIDFQHGSISYMLSSTLTRPTALSPTSRCERIITVKETIDVARLPPPVPQIIPLETIHRKPRRTKAAINGQKSGASSLAKYQQPQASIPSSSAVSETSDESTQSPSISDVSHVSTVSSGKIDSERGSVPLTRHDSANADGHSVAASDEATLNPTATVKLLQSGCLPGDVISVKVAINLGRHFKNPQGIILTLYRECHIDLHPAIPLGSWQDGKKQQYEDYYPRSRTGLGGLSLSSAGSSRVFRQDISQKTTALYVDRQTLAADVKASVQVPEGVFPTISSVPGAMIDFKYYVETIIDLRGKSAIQERILPRLSMVNPVPSFGPGESRYSPDEGYDSMKPLFNPGLSFFETSQIRRDKGVVTHIAEVVVGTKNSERNRLKRTDHNGDRFPPETEGYQEHSSATNNSVHGVLHETNHLSCDVEITYPNYDNYLEDTHTIDFAPAHDVPLPGFEDHVDDKTRLRRAEELLLPSAPPQDGDRESSSPGAAPQHPTAPAAFDEDDLQQFDQSGPSAPAYNRSSTPIPEHVIASTSRSSGENGYDGRLSDDHTEDKQELERRRLQLLASSPNGESTANGIVPMPDSSATAPVLDENSTAIPHVEEAPTHLHNGEHLPRYQA
ncbi:MAG: hypothetical protein Q9166_004713 [cf. Caloplaca sp. 2 TL-2023]